MQSIVLALRYFHLRFQAALPLADPGRRSVPGKGGDTARPPGSSCGSNGNVGQCCTPDAAGTCRPSLGSCDQEEQSALASTSSRVMVAAWRQCPQPCSTWQCDAAGTADSTVPLEQAEKCSGNELLIIWSPCSAGIESWGSGARWPKPLAWLPLAS